MLSINQPQIELYAKFPFQFLCDKLIWQAKNGENKENAFTKHSTVCYSLIELILYERSGVGDEQVVVVVVVVADVVVIVATAEKK